MALTCVFARVVLGSCYYKPSWASTGRRRSGALRDLTVVGGVLHHLEQEQGGPAQLDVRADPILTMVGHRS